MQNWWALVVLFACIVMASAQKVGQKMTNQDVIEMVGMGLSDDLIIDKIRTADTTTFDTSVHALKSLKAANVSDAVLKVMINSHASSGGQSTAGANRDGKELVTRVVGYMGGLPKLQSIKSFRLNTTWTPKSSQGIGSVQIHTTMVFPDRVRVEEESPEGQYTCVVTPEVGFEVTPNTGLQELTTERRTLVLREENRSAVYVGQHLNDPAFTFAYVGMEKIGGIETQMVDIDGDGVSVRWFVEPQTGRILREAYSEEGKIATCDYADWKTADGLTLPDLLNCGDGTLRYNSRWINPMIDTRIFDKPAASSVSTSASERDDALPVENREGTSASPALSTSSSTMQPGHQEASSSTMASESGKTMPPAHQEATSAATPASKSGGTESTEKKETPSVFGAYRGEPDEAKIITTAIEGMTELYNALKDRQSFELDQVVDVRFALKGKLTGLKVDHFCYTYHARNGYGGMDKAYAVYVLWIPRHPEQSAYRMLPEVERNDSDLRVYDNVCYSGAKKAIAVNDITEEVNKALKKLAEQ